MTDQIDKDQIAHFRAAADCMEAMDRLAPFIAEAYRDKMLAAGHAWLKAGKGTDFWAALAQEIMMRGSLTVSRGLFHGSAYMTPVLMDEVLVRQEYYFKATRERPLIIDGGANFGLATYYFKRIYNDARVIAFEPSPDTADLYRRNMERQGWSDVTFHEAALGKDAGEITFYASAKEDPASTVIQSRARDDSQVIKVPQMALRDVITERVDLLKLDIEGAEGPALDGAADKLHLVDHIICECHTVSANGRNSLNKVLNVINKAGFNHFVARSPWAERMERFRPVRRTNNPPSYTVYATRKDLET